MRRPIANIILGLAALVTLIAYPWRQDLWGSLLFHIGGAATIGGLADWYAVTALFKKPLGISFKTELIPRNRQRLVDMAQTMLTEELLRVSHMYQIIKKEHVLVRLLSFFLSPSGKDQVRQTCLNLGKDLLPGLDWTPISREAHILAKEAVGSWRITPLLAQFGRALLEPKTLGILWLHFNRVCQKVIISNAIRPYLIRIVEAILNRYSGVSFARGFLLAFSDSLSPDKLVSLFQSKALDYLQANESLNSPLGSYFTKQVAKVVDNFESNQQWQDFIEDHKNKYLRTSIDRWIEGLAKGGPEAFESLLDQALVYGHKWGEKLLDDQEGQVPVERFLLFRLVPALQKIHTYIGHMVGQELESYSGQDMAHMVKSRLYYDLQMVRVNGSVVGAFLGGLIYGLTLLVKGVI